ncbi:MAG: class I SAM-dependent methyltransferase, partial [Gaiellaceae bacterium]
MSELASSFGRAAEEYEQGRPGYAEAALDAVGLAADAVVLDLAAGTGKLTRQLVRRFARVLAVEPLGGMRAVLDRVVPEAEALSGTATEIPLEDASLDAVFVGEAFHWFATEATLRELARVLRPGGTLAILFNQSEGEIEPPLPAAFWD